MFTEDIKSSLESLSENVKAVTEEDLHMYKSPAGELYEADTSASKLPLAASTKNARRETKNRKGKGNFGADAEDEEWERQMKKELEAKKKKAPVMERVYTKEEQKTMQSQTERRAEVSNAICKVFSTNSNIVFNAVNTTAAPGSLLQVHHHPRGRRYALHGRLLGR